MKVYNQLAFLVKKGNSEESQNFLNDYLPQGSGFDCEMELSEKSNSKKIIIYFGYHPINEHGYYENWLHLSLEITPCLIYGMDFKVNWHGIRHKNKTSLNEFFEDTFSHTLNQSYSLGEE